MRITITKEFDDDVWADTVAEWDTRDEQERAVIEMLREDLLELVHNAEWTLESPLLSGK